MLFFVSSPFRFRGSHGFFVVRSFFGGFWDNDRKTRRKPNKNPSVAASRRPLLEVLEDRLSPATLSAPIVQNTYPLLSPTGGTLNTMYNPQVAVDPTNPNNIVVVANQVVSASTQTPFPFRALLVNISDDGGRTGRRRNSTIT